MRGRERKKKKLSTKKLQPFPHSGVPPVTAISAAATYVFSGSARKTNAEAHSQGCAARPRGYVSPNRLIFSEEKEVIGIIVWTGPGQTALTLILCFEASSGASDRTSEVTAALDAA
mgnify:CR=1 FL=1